MDIQLLVQIVINLLSGAAGYFIGTYEGFRKGINRSARSINEVNRDLDKLVAEYEADKANRPLNPERPPIGWQPPLDEELLLRPDDEVVTALSKKVKKTKKGKKANPATR